MGVMEMSRMYGEYQQALAALCRRRDELANQFGVMGKRLRALEEEIDEMEEDMMFIRKYLK